jgi:ketosteroid isomerase-like protein
MTVTVQSQDQARIRQLLAEREIAMRARDAERLVSRYAREIVKFELVPPLRYTGPEVHDVNGLRSWFLRDRRTD